MKRLIKRNAIALFSRCKYLINTLIGKYNYTYGKDWFYGSELKKNINTYLQDQSIEPIQILEIGSFEGLSSTFLIDNFLRNPHSRITCIDPFMLYEKNDHISLIANKQVENFFYNISQSSYPEKVRYLGITSDEFFKFNDTKYDFIYIDGMHTHEQIPKDILNSWNSLLINGVIWMDDYLGGDGELQNTFDKAIDSLPGRHQIIYRGYQLAIRKVSD